MTFVAVFGGANFYVWARLYQGLGFVFPQANIVAYIVLCTIVSMSLFAGFVPFPVVVKRILMWTGAHWMGLFAYLLAFLLIADIVLLVGGMFKLIPNSAPRMRFCTAAIAVALTLAVNGYGRYNANRIRHAEYEIKTRTEFFPDGMRIVLVSDLHLGAVNSERTLARMVNDINNISPDLVCVAGDIFNNDIDAVRNPEEAARLFKSVNAKHGVFACLGNHDGGGTFAQMLDLLAKGGVTVLKDGHAVVDGRLVLVGRLDPSPIGGAGDLRRKRAGDVLAEAAARSASGLPVVVMDHNPANIGEYDGGVELVLSGHTHRGQIFPGNLITKRMFPVHYGHFQKDGDSPHVVVTSGVGTWGMPLRIATDNEIVIITLR